MSMSRSAVAFLSLVVLAVSLPVEALAAPDTEQLVLTAAASAQPLTECPPFAGAFQVGGGLGLLLFSAPATPDMANACTPINIFDFVQNFPTVTSLSECSTYISMFPSVVPTMNYALGGADGIVLELRGAQATRDRYLGALMLGDSQCAADRLSEYGDHIAQVGLTASYAQGELLGYIDRQNLRDPSYLQQVISAADVKSMRDLLAGGGFPAIDGVALDSWIVSPQERALFQPAFAALTDQDIDAVFLQWDPSGNGQVTLEFVLTRMAFDVIGQTSVPSLAPTAVPGVELLKARLRAAPNPFNPRAEISFELPRSGAITLAVFDLAGRRVATLYEGELTMGPQSFQWNGTDAMGNVVASGVYSVRLDSAQGSQRVKVTLAK